MLENVKFENSRSLWSPLTTRTFDNIPTGHECFGRFIFATKPPVYSAKFAETRPATFRISSFYFLIVCRCLPNTHARITIIVFFKVLDTSYSCSWNTLTFGRPRVLDFSLPYRRAIVNVDMPPINCYRQTQLK